MGTELLLYHHPDAPRIVSGLNEANRRSRAKDVQGYWEMHQALDIQKDTHMPRGTEEIVFHSKKPPEFYPTRRKVHYLGYFLQTQGLTPLETIFGYPSWEPEDSYSIPDWDKSLDLIRGVLRAFPSAPANPRGDPKVFQRHLEALEEMLLWVMSQKDRGSYFLCWSA